MIRSQLDYSLSDPQELERNTNQSELNTIATYYFDGQGKALRPMVAILMARAVNYHVYGENRSVSLVFIEHRNSIYVYSETN